MMTVNFALVASILTPCEGEKIPHLVPRFGM